LYIETTATTGQDLQELYWGMGGASGNGQETFNDIAGGGTSDTSTEPSYSETNVQEAGVDEPDFVKTDGSNIYLVRDQYFLVLKSWPAVETTEISRTEIEGSPSSLFIEGSTAIVFSSVIPQGNENITFQPMSWSVLKATVIDLTDLTSPAVIRELYFDGYFSGTRMVDGKAHIVITSGGYVYQGGGGGGIIVDGGTTGGGSGEPLAGAISRTPGSELLGGYFPLMQDVRYTESGAVSSTDIICSCENVYRPGEDNGTDIVTIFTVDLNDPLAESRSVSIVGAGGIVYGSQSSLYVAAVNYGAWIMLDALEGQEDGPSTKTVIHKFSIDGAGGPDYVASGKVHGWALNQFSLSEWNGDLRIATTDQNWWSGEDPANTLYVLRQNGEDLETVGTLTGLGKPGETIYAVRFLEEKGFVVTFQQMDPLYTLDISDPENPQVAGELEVPGFSTYLHPVGDDHLLAVGTDSSTGGAELSIYNIADLANPVLVDRESLGSGSYTSASYEHKAFTYYASLHALAIPVTAWNEVTPATAGVAATLDNYSVFNGLYIFDVDLTNGFSLLGSIDHAEFYQDQNAGYWYYPESIDRSMFIGTEADGYYVYSVSGRGLKATEFTDLTNDVATVEFPVSDQYWYPYDTVVY